MKGPAKGRSHGFSAVEILVGVAIVSVLGSLVSWGLRSAIERAHEARNIGNLRSIAAGIHAFAAERNGYLWTRQEIGNSSFRGTGDPLGLPHLLRAYLPENNVWLNPAGRPSLRQFGNNYAWSRAENLTTQPVYGGALRASKTILLWDNHTMTLPSVSGVAEPSTGGPRAAPAHFRRFPHRNGTALGWLYLDGHVQIR